MNRITAYVIPGMAILCLACIETSGIALDESLQTPREPPPEISGQYLLDSVDGMPLPFIIDTLPACVGENGVGTGAHYISGGRIEFAEDSTYQFSHAERSVCWPDITVLADSQDGRYLVHADLDIVLTSSGDNAPQSARFTAERAVELVWENRIQLYVRRPLAASGNLRWQEY
jgi:hypothetical protein